MRIIIAYWVNWKLKIETSTGLFLILLITGSNQVIILPTLSTSLLEIELKPLKIKDLTFIETNETRSFPIASEDSRTIRVPEDYSTIQQAINAANPGDTILVASGTYHESISIDKPVLLIGESKETVIIKGLGTGDVIRISSSGVKISGFTVKGSGTRYIGPFDGGNDAGIELDHVMNCTISDLIVTENTLGISLIFSKNNVIANNLVISNSGGGIFLVSSDSNLIINNTSSSNGGHGGIWVASSSSNVIINNIASFNTDHGIKLYKSEDNIVKYNICLYNKNGIFLLTAYNNKIVDNNCSKNRQFGIFLRLSENNVIANNTCEFNEEGGISLDFLNYYNIIKNNEIINNSEWGISLRLSSSHNIVTNNTIILNGGIEKGAGIRIEYSDYNEISYNTISMNHPYGIKIEPRYTVQWEELMEEYKEEVKAKVARGIKVVGENSAGNKINWNNIQGNSKYSVFNGVPTEVNATFNWWGDLSGPYHLTLNPSGKGDEVSGNVLFKPWLNAPVEMRRSVFKVSDLKISPTEAKVGEIVSISVNVTNIRNITEVFTIVLRINGSVKAVRELILPGRRSTKVIFQVIEDKTGTFDVEVDGLMGKFRVKEGRLPRDLYVMISIITLVIAICVGIIIYIRKYLRTSD